MLKKTVIFFSLLPMLCFAGGTQCGPFLLQSGGDGLMHINGARPETQKLIFLGKQEDYRNIKMQWIVPANQPGRWLGMDYIKRDGKAILNVQWLRANMNAMKFYGTYDCVRIK